MYKVAGLHVFNDLDAALECAQVYWDRLGVVVAVEAV